MWSMLLEMKIEKEVKISKRGATTLVMHQRAA